MKQARGNTLSPDSAKTAKQRSLAQEKIIAQAIKKKSPKALCKSELIQWIKDDITDYKKSFPKAKIGIKAIFKLIKDSKYVCILKC